MSISHTKDLGSASSSFSPPVQNSNTNHGFYSLPPQHHQTPPPPTPNSNRQLPQPPPSAIETQFSQSIQITDSFGNMPETLDPVAETTGGSSKKVNKSSESGGKKPVAHQHNVRSVQRGTGTARCREKHADSVVSPYIQQSSSWPANSQESTTHGVGRKTQMFNGNHLLNFHYDHPISRPQSRAPPPPRRHHKRKPYNKDLFLQANYKFVLFDSGHNAPETMDPDKMLMWEDIVCMKYTTPVPVQCPICLDDPLCPQITSCGHIFCFPCILRYFLSSDYDHKGEIWKKCPLCFVMISSKDLHTIYIENVKQLSVGDTAEFILLTRQKDSFLLSLKNKKSIGAGKETPDLFSKFSFTSYVDLSVRNAMSELDGWLARADSGLVDDLEKLPYVCAAMEQLQQRRKHWDERRIVLENVDNKCNDMQPEAWGSPPTENYVEPHSEPCQFVEGPLSGSDNVRLKSVVGKVSDQVVGDASLDQHVDLFEPAEDEEVALSPLCEEGKGMQRNCNGTGGQNEKDSYNFYQAIDGQHLILHPLNLKCLLHHYGSYDMLPHRISGKILQLETVTQTEAMRRRYRFLSHFPLTTTFQLCEIDLDGLLPPDALALFMDEIKNREMQRKRLAKKERQEKIKAEAAATAELANHVAATMAYHNTAERPQDITPSFSMEDFEALGGGSSSVVAASSPPTNIKMHFANVARFGFAAGHDSPALRLYGSTPSKPTKSEAANVADVSCAVGGMLRKNSETPSFANVIARAKAVPAEEEPTTRTSEVAAKKGKKPTKVLLSTGGGRRY